MMRAAPALPSRILVCGRNDQLSRHAFHDAVGLTPRDPVPASGEMYGPSDEDMRSDYHARLL